MVKISYFQILIKTDKLLKHSLLDELVKKKLFYFPQ